MLHVAAQGDSVYAIAYFLRYSFLGINSIDKSHSTALHWACISHAHTAVKFLLAWGAEVDKTDLAGYTPLHLALRDLELDTQKSFQTVRLLMQYRAPLMILDTTGKMPEDYIHQYTDAILKSQTLRLLRGKESVAQMLCYTQNGEDQVAPIKLSWIERWWRNFLFLLMLFAVKSLMFMTMYYIYPHVQHSLYKITLSTFFLLIIITFVAAAHSKPIFLNDNDMLRVPNETEGKMLQLLRRHDAAEICPHCEIVTRVDSRHCFACNKCVVSFDTHCNVLNNCINTGNRMSYILFLGSVLCFLLSLVAIAITHFEKPTATSRFAIGMDNLPQSGRDTDTPFRVVIVLVFLAAVAGIVPIA